MGFDSENNDRLNEILKKEYFNTDTLGWNLWKIKKSN